MEPERTEVLAVWKLDFRDEELKGEIAYFNANSKPGEKIRVRFDVDRQPPGFFPVHGGVVYVWDSEGVTREPESPDMAPVKLENCRLRWHEGGFLPGSVPMMVLVLPEHYTIANLSTPPVAAKDFGGRIALYWRPIADEKGSADVEWELRKSESAEGSLQKEILRLNQSSSKAPPSSKVDVEAKVVFPLHGIRTVAHWHRTFADVAHDAGWYCRLEKWFYGKFSLLQFISRRSREAKLEWFEDAYMKETGTRGLLNEGRLPSVVAHSFGTYILGHALLKYTHLRFDKVILCGSILPCDFPWGGLIDRGQVQGVRNEYGVRDIWAEHVGWFIGQTGPSGKVGFRSEHERLLQEEFRYSHSEYFKAGHMKRYWLPFLDASLPVIADSKAQVPTPRRTYPAGLYVLYTALSLALAAAIWFANRT